MRRAVLALLLIAAVGGCGLEDYEKRMTQARERLKKQEQEDKDLGMPIQLPTKPAAKGKLPEPLARLFLRVPRGLQTQPAKAARNGMLYVYSPPTAAANPAAPFLEVVLAFGDLGDKTFIDKVLTALPQSSLPVKKQVQIGEPGQKQLPLERATFDSGTLAYSVNFWRGKDVQVAVGYAWVKGQPAGPRVVETSLKTFAGDDAALAAAGLYQSGGPLGPVAGVPTP